MHKDLYLYTHDSLKKDKCFKKEPLDLPGPFHDQDELLYNRQKANLFGEFGGHIEVGVNPNAKIAAINPRFQGMNFGSFVIPTIKQVVQNDIVALSKLHKVWSRLSHFNENRKIAFVPPETGRAILLPESNHARFKDILVKGTGLVDKFVKGNKLRFSERGFNGVLELCEAERDMINTDILARAGVLVAPALGIINHNIIQRCDDFTSWIGNYVRAFRVQTRISNLFELSPFVIKKSIDQSIDRMNTFQMNKRILNYIDYFEEIIKISARNVAYMQGMGFTQDSFHFGQVTLMGELVDFGVGSFKNPKKGKSTLATLGLGLKDSPF